MSTCSCSCRVRGPEEVADQSGRAKVPLSGRAGVLCLRAFSLFAPWPSLINPWVQHVPGQSLAQPYGGRNQSSRLQQNSTAGFAPRSLSRSWLDFHSKRRAKKSRALHSAIGQSTLFAITRLLSILAQRNCAQCYGYNGAQSDSSCARAITLFLPLL